MTALLKKLNFKDHKSIIVLNVPQQLEAEIKRWQENAPVLSSMDEAINIDFLICFITQKAVLESTFAALGPRIQTDATIWICYPKASSKRYSCDFNRDKGWDMVADWDMEPVRQVSIDEDWSGLRFRKTKYIKTITRNPAMAITSEGKRRTSASC